MTTTMALLVEATDRATDADSPSRCTWRRSMWAPIFLAVGVVLLTVPLLKQPQKQGLQVTQLHQDLKKDKKDFAATVKDLAEQLKILRSQAPQTSASSGVSSSSNGTIRFLAPPEMGGPPDMDKVRKRILELLPLFQGKISPFAAAKLGIAVTEDDLELLGVSAGEVEEQEEQALGRRLSFGPGKPWKGGNVPFCFRDYDDVPGWAPVHLQLRVIDGIHAWEKAVGCLNFQQVEPKTDGSFRCEVEPAIYITGYAEKGHFSGVGMDKDSIQMNFDTGDSSFSWDAPDADRALSIGTVIHELGHALGMHHEHVRSDRDMYVEVLEENFNFARFQDKWDSNYKIHPRADTQRPYDVLSIMHYGRGEWSSYNKNQGEPLLRARKRACWTYGVRGDDFDEDCEKIRMSMGQRMGVTQFDADQVADLYRSENSLCKSSFALQSIHIHYLNLPREWPVQHWLPRTTQVYNTMSMQEMSRVRCWSRGKFWLATDGGGELGFDSDGFLKFWEGKGGEQEERVRQHVWSSAHCGGSRRRRRYCKKGGMDLCLQPGGNLVVYSGKGPNGEPKTDVWQSQTHEAPKKAVGLVVYDRHWAMIGRDPHRHYVNYSIFSYPAGAPVTMEVGFWGYDCLYQVSFETSQGTKLEFVNGNLQFSTKQACRDGNYRLLWESNTEGMGGCLRFYSSGQLCILRGGSSAIENQLWKTGTDQLDRTAAKIVISTYEWYMVDRFGRVLAVYPPMTNNMRLDTYAATQGPSSRLEVPC